MPGWESGPGGIRLNFPARVCCSSAGRELATGWPLQQVEVEDVSAAAIWLDHFADDPLVEVTHLVFDFLSSLTGP